MGNGAEAEIVGYVITFVVGLAVGYILSVLSSNS